VRLLKWVSLGLGAIVALAVLGVLVLVWFVDPNSFKSNIESAVRDATGRELTLVGDIELKFFPWLALRTGEGRFANPPGFGSEAMATWKSAQLGARLLPLLRGELVADRVVLRGADLRLVRLADGTANWEGLGGTQPAAPEARSEAAELRIDGVRIEDSRLSFEDQAASRSVEVTGLNLTTDEIAPGEPLTDTEIAGRLHMAGFAPAGVPFRVEVPKVTAPRDFSSVQVGAFEVEFGEFIAEGEVGGTLGEQARLAGRIQTNAFNPRSLLTSVGVAAPRTTDPKALAMLRFSGTWRFDAGAIALEPFELALDDTTFSGAFRRGAGPLAIGDFTLRGDSLDIARYVPPPDPASEPFVLPTALLQALRFRGTVELAEAAFGDVDMKGVVLRLLLDEQGLRSAAPQPQRAP
jgi:AsmA protein